jgi:hypothetical protein
MEKINKIKRRAGMIVEEEIHLPSVEEKPKRKKKVVEPVEEVMPDVAE